MIKNNKLTKNAIEKMRKILEDKKLQKRIVEHNYKLGGKYFSYEILEKKLRKLIK